MAARKKDPTEAMRLQASRYPGADKGTACTQSSFKTGGKAFFFCGPHGDRYKAMFKLDRSKAAAAKLAEQAPDDYRVGSSVWVTARFSAEQPMPRARWTKWLDESYALSQAPAKKKAAKPKAAKPKAAKKKAPGKSPAKQKASKKKVAKKGPAKKKKAKARRT